MTCKGLTGITDDVMFATFQQSSSVTAALITSLLMFLPLDKIIFSGVITAIVSVSDGRAETLLEPPK